MNALAMVMGGALPISDAAIRHARVVTSESRAKLSQESTDGDLPEVASRLLGILRAAGCDMIRKALAAEAGIALTSSSPYLELLKKNGLVQQIRVPGKPSHYWRAMPVLPDGRPVQPEMPDVLRQAGDQREAEQKTPRRDAGGDRKNTGKSGKGGGAAGGGRNLRTARNVYLSDAEYALLRTLGGSVWVRERILEAGAS